MFINFQELLMEIYAFTVDDVRIPPQKQIGLHSHSQWELSHVVNGAGTRTIGDLTEPFTEGEIILIPPGIPHRWRFNRSVTDAEGNIANLSVFFDSTLIASMKDIFPEIAEPLERLESLEHAVAYQGKQHGTLKGLLKMIRGKTPVKRLPLMIELLIALSDFSEGINTGRNSSLTRVERRLEKVRVYCACNYDSQIALDEMSRHVGMNKSAFCTFMRNNTGMTFTEYLNNMRLERAKDKLRLTDSSIAEIAVDCGFQNVTYFNRLFRMKYGCSPKEIRKAKDMRST